MASQRQNRREELKRSAKGMAFIPVLIVAVIAVAVVLFKGPKLYRDFRIELGIGGYIPEGHYVGVLNDRDVCLDIDKDIMTKTDRGYVADVLDAQTGEKITTCTFYFKNQRLWCMQTEIVHNSVVVNIGKNSFATYRKDAPIQNGERVPWFTFTKA